ncbi:MAG: hypothetical protein JO302_00915 [Candidatus Eremiobacteraeota bacterium]|nr:hypothetical protein [Candidatus Eremiobacteraeota bacterium]
MTQGSEVSVYYDPMLAKLIVNGSNRAQAIARLEGALEDFAIGGVRTNLPLLLWIARDEAFRAGKTTTGFLTERLDESLFRDAAVPQEAVVLAAAALLVDGRAPFRIGGIGMPLRLQRGAARMDLVADATATPNTWFLSGDAVGELRAERRGAIVRAQFGDAPFSGAAGQVPDGVSVTLRGSNYQFSFAPPPSFESAGGAQGVAADGRVVAPMPGKIVKIAVHEGQRVDERALLLVLEAMKMEHRLEATNASTVKAILVKEGQIVPGGAPLLELSG